MHPFPQVFIHCVPDNEYPILQERH